MTIQIAGTDIIDQSRNILSSTFQNYTETVNALGTLAAGTVNIDLSNGNVVTATLPTSGTVTFTFTTGVSSGAVSFTLYLTNPASGTPTINWPVAVEWTRILSFNNPPVYSTTSNKISVWSFITTNNGSKWYGALSKDNL